MIYIVSMVIWNIFIKALIKKCYCSSVIVYYIHMRLLAAKLFDQLQISAYIILQLLSQTVGLFFVFCLGMFARFTTENKIKDYYLDSQVDK